ncbi:MAG: hypothetical protein A2787_07425 [Omnitrophica WOR_2 bacterium RIFCSPHIGHO2_01_FULL_48_9]|nr:MAG: hypothetical protein A3D10_00310 [Omnitrophica WOR_2 bacterium RIFCSPHIGHO2_02_FULL_48_11]OGX32799.1 MAG: hypothetical protein A2787_07425 [Omnitrophica WOR_2 bacterium RIFCSPHIGHO2_01_FULL_48_9]
MERPSVINDHEDMIVTLIRAQISSLLSVLNHIEMGNTNVNDTLKRVEKNLRCLRTDILSED